MKKDAIKIELNLIEGTYEEVMSILNYIHKKYGERMYFAHWNDVKVITNNTIVAQRIDKDYALSKNVVK